MAPHARRFPCMHGKQHARAVKDRGHLECAPSHWCGGGGWVNRDHLDTLLLEGLQAGDYYQQWSDGIPAKAFCLCDSLPCPSQARSHMPGEYR